MEVSEDMKCFTEQCSLGFAQRYLAAQKDAYPVILSYCRKSVEEQEAVLAALSALSALTDGQPDLLDAEGQQFLLDVLNKYQADSSVTCVAICAIRHCCLKHEQNRQDLIKGGVLPLLTTSITRHSGCAELVKEACAALRVMTFDDDVRVTFGHAHEHAKMIVLEHSGLKVLVEAAKGEAHLYGWLRRPWISKIRFSSQSCNVFISHVAALTAHLDNTSVLSEVCGTLSRLAVRNEFCQDICDLGGLKLIMTLLADCYETAVVYQTTRYCVADLFRNQFTCLFCSLTWFSSCRSWSGRSSAQFEP